MLCYVMVPGRWACQGGGLVREVGPVREVGSPPPSPEYAVPCKPVIAAPLEKAGCGPKCCQMPPMPHMQHLAAFGGIRRHFGGTWRH